MTDLLAMAIGGAVADLIIAVYLGARLYRAHHRVSHRKLRATAEARGKPATGSLAPRSALVAGPELRAGRAVRRGSADPPASGEPQPAPGPSSQFNPGAGPELHADAAWIRAQASQADLNLRTKIQVWPPKPELIGDSAVTPSSVESQPAPGPLAGRGPQPGGRCRAPDMAPAAAGAASREQAAPATRSAA